MLNNSKEKLIEKISTVLNSKTSNLSADDKALLMETKLGLEKAKSKEEILKALTPLANLLQVTIKTIVDIFSG